MEALYRRLGSCRRFAEPSESGSEGSAEVSSVSALAREGDAMLAESKHPQSMLGGIIDGSVGTGAGTVGKTGAGPAPPAVPEVPVVPCVYTSVGVCAGEVLVPGVCTAFSGSGGPVTE